MALNDLLARLERESGTYGTAADSADVPERASNGEACTAGTSGTSQNGEARFAIELASESPESTFEHEFNQTAASSANTGQWLAAVAGHLDSTPNALLAVGVILPDEVPHYADREPQAVAYALRLVHPGCSRTREPDDRRHCRACLQLAGDRCRARNLLVMDELPRRCFDYQPNVDDYDQRPGVDRWPSMQVE